MVAVRARKEVDHWVCEVTVDYGGQHSQHMVTVRQSDLEGWAAGSNKSNKKDVEDLVSRSFDFLLEREPPGSILPKFELSVIQRYFPDFDGVFRRR
jgi:hypothetical protein